MFISAYCKICELNTEHESVFAADVSVVSLIVRCNFFWTISGSQMGSKLLQNTEIIKQTDVLLWKIWRKYRSVSYLFSCNMNAPSKIFSTHYATDCCNNMALQWWKGRSDFVSSLWYVVARAKIRSCCQQLDSTLQTYSYALLVTNPHTVKSSQV